MPMSDHDWSKPAAVAIPQEGYFEHERGRYGPIYPRTPACYGFSIIAKVKEGREEAVRAYGKQIEEAIAGSPDVLAPLRLHYLRWVLFDVGSGLHFQYQGIFDTDFDKYTEDAVALFSATGITTVFTNLEGFPEDWKENPEGGGHNARYGSDRHGRSSRRRWCAIRRCGGATQGSQLARGDQTGPAAARAAA
jgi:hypothetical protein